MTSEKIYEKYEDSKRFLNKENSEQKKNDLEKSISVNNGSEIFQKKSLIKSKSFPLLVHKSIECLVSTNATSNKKKESLITPSVKENLRRRLINLKLSKQNSSLDSSIQSRSKKNDKESNLKKLVTSKPLA
jgi:hypothetical protein